jgi:hypothetical protein
VVGRDDSRRVAGDDGPSLAWLGESGAGLRTLAGIWATVDLERALADLGHGSPDGAVFDDPLLGARVAIVSTGGDGTRIAIAEPATEGRLAATLARHGEGLVGRYVLSPVGLGTVRVLAAAAGVTISRPEVGPFGSAVLVVTASVAGPHLILVDPQLLVDPQPAPADPAAVPSPP